jgi:hypothetical protein
MMADLFQTTIPNINIHLQNIYPEGELQEISTIKDLYKQKRHADCQKLSE